MRDNVDLFAGLFFALIFLVVGATLLNDAVSSADPGQSASLISGAAFFSLGVTTTFGVLRNWWRSRRMLERFRNG